MLTSHHGRPSSTPRQRAILSLFLPQGWQFKGNWGRERALSCMQIILAGAGRMKGTLEHWSKKRLCSPEYGYVFPLLLLLCLKSFNFVLQVFPLCSSFMVDLERACSASRSAM